MKTYTGIETCKFCGKKFEWEFIDDGYRPWMRQYVSPAYVINTDPLIAKCKRYIAIPKQSEYLSTHCPHCDHPILIECSESMIAELNS